jgi:hypothetical protein
MRGVGERSHNLETAAGCGAYEFDRWCFVQLRKALDASTPPELPASAVLAPAKGMIEPERVLY